MKKLKYIIVACFTIFLFNVKVGALECTYKVSKVMSDKFYVSFYSSVKIDTIFSEFLARRQPQKLKNLVKVDDFIDLSLNLKISDDDVYMEISGVTWSSVWGGQNYFHNFGISSDSWIKKYPKIAESSKLNIDNKIAKFTNSLRKDECPAFVSFEIAEATIPNEQFSENTLEFFVGYPVNSYYLDNGNDINSVLEFIKNMSKKINDDGLSTKFPDDWSNFTFPFLMKPSYVDTSVCLSNFYYNDENANVRNILGKYDKYTLDGNNKINSSDVAHLLKEYNCNKNNEINKDMDILNNYLENDWKSLNQCINLFHVVVDDSIAGIDYNIPEDFLANKIDSVSKYLEILNETDSSLCEEVIGAAEDENNFVSEFEVWARENNICIDKSANPEKFEDCMKREMEKILNQINCNTLWKKNDSELNVVEKYIKSLTQKDQSINNISPYELNEKLQELCKEKKNSLIEQHESIIDGTSENQKKLEEYISSRYPGMISPNGVDVVPDTKLCKTLNDALAETGLYNLIRIGGPVLVILLTFFDGAKAIASSKEEEFKKFMDRLKIRLICVALLFLIPTIINFLTKIVVGSICTLKY